MTQDSRKILDDLRNPDFWKESTGDCFPLNAEVPEKYMDAATNVLRGWEYADSRRCKPSK